MSSKFLKMFVERQATGQRLHGLKMLHGEVSFQKLFLIILNLLTPMRAKSRFS
jgi:hypothetical protein